MTVLCVSKLRVNVDDSELGGGILPTFFVVFYLMQFLYLTFKKKKNKLKPNV